MSVWIAMVGVKPSIANKALYGASKGAYFWVAGRAKNEKSFRQSVGMELARRGLRLDEVSDVMLGEDAVKKRRGADIDWDRLIASARDSPGIVIDSQYFIYEQADRAE